MGLKCVYTKKNYRMVVSLTQHRYKFEVINKSSFVHIARKKQNHKNSITHTWLVCKVIHSH